MILVILINSVQKEIFIGVMETLIMFDTDKKGVCEGHGNYLLRISIHSPPLPPTNSTDSGSMFFSNHPSIPFYLISDERYFGGWSISFAHIVFFMNSLLEPSSAFNL